MLEGKVSAALKWLSTSSSNGTPVLLNEDTVSQLKAKHPEGQALNESCMIQGPLLPGDLCFLRRLVRKPY